MIPVSFAFELDLRQLRTLRAVRHHGTIAAAAGTLHLTPSAVSQQISALSRQAGIPLVVRAGRTVRMTPEAEVLLEHSEVIFAELERTRVELMRHGEGDTARLTIGAFASAITSVVAPALSALRRARPGLQLTVNEIEAPACFDRLDDGTLDVVVTVDYRGGPARNDRRYHRLDLHRDAYNVALPARHPLCSQDNLSLLDLADEPWITATGFGPCGEIPLAACAAAGFVPEIVHHLSDYSAALALVDAGAGITILPTLAIVAPPPSVTIRPLIDPPTRNIYAAVRAGTEASPGLRAVLAALTDSCPTHSDFASAPWARTDSPPDTATPGDRASPADTTRRREHARTARSSEAGHAAT